MISIRNARVFIGPTASFLAMAACSSRQNTPNDSIASRAGATTNATGSGAPLDTALVPVRGTIAAVSDTLLSITTAGGTQQVHVSPPLRVYQRTTSDLAHVTPNAFVGITSVPQPDGSQRATEIHIFPEELRGTGEGSRLMDSSSSGGRSTMTNGAVSSPSRMTNGAVGSTQGTNTFMVRYAGGQQTIQIPPNVSVTAITPAQTRPTAGANVVVLAHKSGAGQLNTSALMLLGPTGK
ncbi:MAG: hypothetical protein ACJ796_15010 [Gemmatimonadaceae bacterium]